MLIHLNIFCKYFYIEIYLVSINLRQVHLINRQIGTFIWYFSRLGRKEINSENQACSVRNFNFNLIICTRIFVCTIYVCMYICILHLHTCPAEVADSAQFSFSVKQANRVVHRLHLGKTTGIMLIKVNAFLHPSSSPAKCQRQLLLLLLVLLYPIAILPPSSS